MYFLMESMRLQDMVASPTMAQVNPASNWHSPHFRTCNHFLKGVRLGFRIVCPSKWVVIRSLNLYRDLLNLCSRGSFGFWADMQRGLERSLGADWGSKWCKCGRQKVRRLKTCNPSYHFHSGMWQKFVKTAASVKTMQDGEEYLWAAACCWPINWLEDEGPGVKMQLQLRTTTPPNFSANQNHPTFSDSWLMMGSRIL